MTQRARLIRLLLAAGIATAGVFSGPSGVSATVGESQDIAFREESGFRSDLAYVRSVRGDPAAQSDRYPIALTPAERAEMDRRLRMEAQLGAATAYTARFADTFGGMYIDQRAGGVLDFGFTAGADVHRAALTAVAPPESQFRVRVVDNSLETLEATHATILNDLEFQDALGIKVPSIWTDIPGNRVAVGISPYSAASVELLLERDGGDRIRVYATGEGSTTACTGRETCKGPPLRAGIALYPHGCTSGFIATHAAQYAKVILTAGHCLVPYAFDTMWTHNGQNVGRQKHHGWAQNTPADAGVIDFVLAQDVSNYVYRSPTAVDRVWYRQALNGDVVGGYVCQSGRISGIKCGYIKSKNASPILSGVQLVRQRYASYLVKSGDSGGPIWSPYAEYGITAYGIQSGVLDSDGDGVQELNLNEWSVYSHIAEVEAKLGVTVYAICCN